MGELSNFSQWGQNPCVFLPCLFPTTFINNGFWWLRKIWLGVECGRTVNPCPHSHSTSGLNLTLGKNNDPDFVVHPSRRHFLPLHEFAEHPHTAISRPPCSCSPSCTSNCLLIVFTHRNFSGLTHAVFPLRI